MTKPRSSKKNYLFIFLFISLIIVFLFFTIGSIIIGNLALTYDEPSHIRYGAMVLQLKTDIPDTTSEMPVSVLNIIPIKLVTHLLGPELADLRIGKISTVFVSLLLGILCFVWVRSLSNKWIGLLVFGLFVFEPNIIAHSQVITTDIYSAAAITLTLFLCQRFMDTPNLRLGILLGLALGLCQISKISGILLYPILLLLVFIRYGKWFIIQLWQKAYQNIGSAILVSIKYGTLILVGSVFVINLGYLFNRSGTPLSDYKFKSTFFQSIQNSSPFLSKLPVPLPYPYIKTLDYLMYDERISNDYGKIYLLGKINNSSGFPGYFIVAFLLKVPLPIVILLFMSLWDWLRSFRKDEFIRQDMFLLVPALIYSIYFNFFFRAQTGIRYLLVIFPILLVFSVRIFRKWPLFSRRAWIILSMLGCYLIISVVSYFPNYLSYFNEFVINRTFAYRYLADSNLDWGQNQNELSVFLSQHPDYHFDPPGPTSGIVLVGVNEFLGVLGPLDDFRWLRENFEPIGNFRYTYLIFDISPTDLTNIK